MLLHASNAACRHSTDNDAKPLGGDLLFSPTASPTDLPVSLVEWMATKNRDASVRLTCVVDAFMGHRWLVVRCEGVAGAE